MKRIKNVLIFFLAMVMLGACRDKKSEKKEEENIQQENTFVNPLKTEGAQCWANYYDGWYYYMQEAVDRLELWRTRDITDLEHAEHKVIWIPKDPSNAHHLWGPEIHPIAGKWYVYMLLPTIIWIIINYSYWRIVRQILSKVNSS